MRLLSTVLSSILLYVPLAARPLSFEQRSPALYRAHVGNGDLTIQPNSVGIGEITLRFANAAASVKIEAVGQSSPATYISGNSSQTFRQFPKLALRQLYPGIDVIFYGNGEHLEYDLVVSPGADLHRLRLLFDGARKVDIDKDGNLSVEGRSRNFTQMRPRVFQADGRRIPTRYVSLSKNQVGFRIGTYNRQLALTIDPELVFTKYFGGSASDAANAVTTDAQGNVYIAGTSNSVDFPTTSGVQPRIKAPLATLSGANMTPMPISSETSVLAIGGTSDGSVLYAISPDAVFVSSDHGNTWTQTGPWPLGGIPISPVNGITVDEIDPSRVFVATTRGMYFSGDGGHTFGPHGYGIATGASGYPDVTKVIVSPIDHLIVYVATIQPIGIFKSTDGGNAFTDLDPTYPGQPQTVPPYQTNAMALGTNGSDLYVIDPYNTLLKSTDGGATWQKLGATGFGTIAIVLDPANAMNIYVLNYSGIQKSSDGGATFGTLVPASSVPGSLQYLVLDTASGTLYFEGTPNLVYAVSTNGGTATTLPNVFYDLHSLVTIGGKVYAAFETLATPYVVKWDPTGTTILYSTFIGGSGQDSIAALAVDAQGNCVIAGTTSSADFPVTNKLSGSPASPSLPSGFVAKLGPDGTKLVYSALLGGSRVVGAPILRGTSIAGVALDSTGAAYVTGQSDAPDFPLSPNAFQSARPQSTCNRGMTNFLTPAEMGVNAFVSKIAADGSQLAYSTLLTGSCGSAGSGIAVDSAGEAVVAGFTNSSDLPTSTGAYQAAFPGSPDQVTSPNAFQVGFAAKLSAGGDKLIAGTYLGGSYLTRASSVALDSSGNTYLTGTTLKILPGATAGAYQTTAVDRCVIPISIGPSLPYTGTNDAYVLKLDPTLSSAKYLTYLGGGCDDSGFAIALDPVGNAWVTGITLSPDFPLKSPFQGAGSGSRFISEISADGSQLLFSSATDGFAVAVDPGGAAHVVGSGSTSTIAKRTQSFGGSGTAAEWVKIAPTAPPAVEIDNIQPVNGFPPTPLPAGSFGFGVAPGQLMRITGRNLGPATQAKGQLDATGRLTFTLGGTIVLFDNIPAPLASVQDTEIICFAPFEISQSTTVTVESGGQRSNPVRLGVVPSNLQMLTVTNADGSVNSAAHPAKLGDVVVLYVSGLGQTKPLSADGLTNTAPLPVPTATMFAFAGGVQTKPEFVGAAPGQVAGITQINLRLPAALSPGSSNVVNIGLNNVNTNVYVSQ